MSKINVKKEQNKNPQKNTATKKKRWKLKSKKSKVKNSAPNSQQSLPPKDANQFSINWKSLQEVLKASQQKTEPQKPSNGILEKAKSKEISLNNFSKKKNGLSQTDSGHNGKQKNVKDVVSKEHKKNVNPPAGVNLKLASNSKKKKHKLSESDSGPAAKKKKVVVKEPTPTEADLWFDDVDPDDIEATLGPEAAEIMRKKQGISKKEVDKLVKERAFEGITRAVAIDCEMVGVGPEGQESILARVSLVNQFGKCLYDKYVKPTEKVTDYRTAVSGIRPQDIKDGEDMKTVQQEVAEILKGRIVVGHAIHNDLKILLLDHPKKHIRDTQKYKPFRKTVKTKRPSLKLLCKEILNVRVQQGEHSSVQDAQATMRLYTMVKKQWEADIKTGKFSLTAKNARKPKSPKNTRKQFTGR
ncbi:RNA exonuclease 4 [Neosynchiropus ocellatus]